MRTFIFCTSYIQPQNSTRSVARWQRWMQFYSERKELLGAEQIFLIDDATPIEYIPIGIQVINADNLLPEELPDYPVMFRFGRHYGRSSLSVLSAFPGWWRSFIFSSQVAKKYSFSKIIHCESDAFVISHRMAGYIRDVKEGWVAFWCPLYGFAETAIQVICEDSFANFEKYCRYGKRFWFQRRRPTIAPEKSLPFTVVEKSFIGDRYGEYRDDYPDDADYVCQSSERWKFGN
jgi:hypothetical protein